VSTEQDQGQSHALDPKGAARYLCLGLSKVMQLSHAGVIPCRNINPGGERAVFRYSVAALDEWLAGDGPTQPKVLPGGPPVQRKARVGR